MSSGGWASEGIEKLRMNLAKNPGRRMVVERPGCAPAWWEQRRKEDKDQKTKACPTKEKINGDARSLVALVEV